MKKRQSHTGPELPCGNIEIDMIFHKVPKWRQTKIFCTLGPACWEVPQLEELIHCGMNVARFNFSHGDHEGHKACLDRLRQACKNTGKNVAVLLDTKGPEIRTGFFADGAKKINLEKGQELILTADYSHKGDSSKLACSYPELAISVNPGQKILVADGSLVLTVLSCDTASGEVKTRVENNAGIGERKNMNLPGVVVNLPTLTEKDISDIQQWGVPNGIDFIAASFVRKASDVLKIREVLGPENQGVKIIVKIENQEGIENFDEILEVTDGVMVARGDMGMEIPPEKVFLAQKMMIRKANIAGKPVVTATQMLESMITNPRPTRAECSDVANAVLDGTDAVMLSGETANGENPAAAVTIMAETCIEAESAVDNDALYSQVRNSVLGKFGTLPISESVSSSAVKTGIDIGTKAIIVCSDTGRTAQQVAKFRSGRKIIVLTPNEQVARQMYGFCKGAKAVVIDNSCLEQAILREIETLVTEGILETGDPVVVILGKDHVVGSTNTMKVLIA
jgi:pyruvate kinase